MNNTKDKVEDGKFNLDEVFDSINLFKYISNAQDEMSKDSIKSSIDEYNLIYLEDEVYLNLIHDLKRFCDFRADEFTKIRSKDNISQEERDSILNYIKSELDPRIKDLEIKIDTRRSEIESYRKDYVKESDEKKTPRKNALLGLCLSAPTFALFANPKIRKMIIDSGTKLADDAIKKSTKLL